MSIQSRIVRSFLYPLMLWRRGELDEQRFLREFEKSQYLPAEEIRALQWARVQSLLEHAYQNCPFYRERFQHAALHPSDIQSLEDLRYLPILEKSDLQQQRDRLIAANWPRHDLIVNQSGGSTGHPVSFFQSRIRKQSRAAATIRHNRWAGWEIGDKVACLWGAARDLREPGLGSSLRSRLIDRQLTLDMGCVTEKGMRDFALQLQRFQPRVLLGYARALAMFARFLRARGLDVCRPHSIVSSAEMLETEERRLLEDVFGCPVFNRYGCREVSVIASECSAHSGLHMMAEGLYVEVVQGNEPASAGQTGSILVTDLLNEAMPLIRYRIGDMGAWAEGACPCGRTLPRLQKLAGRISDMVVGPDGRLVSGLFLATYVIAQRPSLGQVQIRQQQAGRVLYRIKSDREFCSSDDLEFLTRATRGYVGAETIVDLEFVDDLPAEPSGKFLFCRSEVTPDYVGAGAVRAGE